MNFESYEGMEDELVTGFALPNRLLDVVIDRILLRLEWKSHTYWISPFLPTFLDVLPLSC